MLGTHFYLLYAEKSSTLSSSAIVSAKYKAKRRSVLHTGQEGGCVIRNLIPNCTRHHFIINFLSVHFGQSEKIKFLRECFMVFGSRDLSCVFMYNWHSTPPSNRELLVQLSLHRNNPVCNILLFCATGGHYQFSPSMFVTIMHQICLQTYQFKFFRFINYSSPCIKQFKLLRTSPYGLQFRTHAFLFCRTCYSKTYTQARAALSGMVN